jgi:hypothetical protein
MGTNPRIRQSLAERVADEHSQVLMPTGDTPFTGASVADWQDPPERDTSLERRACPDFAGDDTCAFEESRIAAGVKGASEIRLLEERISGMSLLSDGQHGEQDDPGESHGMPVPCGCIHCDLSQLDTLQQVHGTQANNKGKEP